MRRARPQKIKTLHRSLEDHLPTSSSSTAPVSRNLDPALHPFARSREYTRAVTAAKLDRMFAKPFVASLEGHADGIYSLTKDESGALGRVASGSGDGEVRVWDLGGQRTVWNVENAHRGMVKGVAFSHPMVGEEGRVEKKVGAGERGVKRKRTDLGYKGKGRAGLEDDLDDEEYEEGVQDLDQTQARGSSRVLSCGADKTVKLWDIKGAKGRNARVSGTAAAMSLEVKTDPSSHSHCKPSTANLASSASKGGPSSSRMHPDVVILQLHLAPPLRSRLCDGLDRDRDLGRDQDGAALDAQVPLDVEREHGRAHCVRRVQQERDERPREQRER